VLHRSIPPALMASTTAKTLAELKPLALWTNAMATAHQTGSTAGTNVSCQMKTIGSAMENVSSTTKPAMASASRVHSPATRTVSATIGLITTIFFVMESVNSKVNLAMMSVQQECSNVEINAGPAKVLEGITEPVEMIACMKASHAMELAQQTDNSVRNLMSASDLRISHTECAMVNASK